MIIAHGENINGKDVVIVQPMKGTSDIILAIQELKRAKEYFDSFSREYPGTI